MCGIDEKASNYDWESWMNLDGRTGNDTKAICSLVTGRMFEENALSLRATSTTAQGPEKLWVVAFGNFLELAICCYDFKLNNVVNLHAEFVSKWVVASCLHPTTDDANTLRNISEMKLEAM